MITLIASHSLAVDHSPCSDRVLRFFRNRNLAVSSVNNGMMFLIWTLPSVLGVMLQSAHDADPSVYHFEGAGDSLQSGVSADRCLSRSCAR